MPESVIHHGDCREVMATFEPCSVDSVITDPPYGIGFMGRGWDHGVPGVPFWVEAVRVLKPGGYLLAFGGTRTFHRLTCAIEDAGFEIRDCLSWLYGSGFPKSLDVSKAIDKAAGAEREITERVTGAGNRGVFIGDVSTIDGGGTVRWNFKPEHDITTPATDAAKEWAGWGTALKPAWEPIIMARKPISGSSVTIQVRHAVLAGCGECNGIGWIGEPPSDDEINAGPFDHVAPSQRTYGKRCEACNGSGKLPTGDFTTEDRVISGDTVAANVLRHGTGAINVDGCRIGTDERINQPAGNKPGGASLNLSVVGMPQDADARTAFGRWPANVALDEQAAALLDEQSGEQRSPTSYVRAVDSRNLDKVVSYGAHIGEPAGKESLNYGDTGGASRFFYTAKASTSERRGSKHPTVKPLDLMRWLVRMVTPPGGTVLDPFAGSGTTMEAALNEGFNVIGIEQQADYVADISNRLNGVAVPLPFD